MIPNHTKIKRKLGKLTVWKFERNEKGMNMRLK
jgi:hypothetical protein